MKRLERASQLNWPAVEKAGEAIAALAVAAQYTAPEDLGMHGDRIRRVCRELQLISEALLITSGALAPVEYS